VGNFQLCGYSGSNLCPVSPSPVTPSSSPTTSKGHGRKLSTKDIILIAAGVLLVVLLLLCFILLCCLIRRRAASKAKDGGAVAGPSGTRAGKGVPPTVSEVEAGGEAGGKLVHFDGPMAFTADDLLCATAEIMGKSTYGTVYKATLEDGSQVAVKRLREKITKNQREFETEVNAIGKIRHANLLAMRAYYLGPKGEKLLVFDYVSRGSLASFLHGESCKKNPINFTPHYYILLYYILYILLYYIYYNIRRNIKLSLANFVITRTIDVCYVSNLFGKYWISCVCFSTNWISRCPFGSYSTKICCPFVSCATYSFFGYKMLLIHTQIILVWMLLLSNCILTINLFY